MADSGDAGEKWLSQGQRRSASSLFRARSLLWTKFSEQTDGGQKSIQSKTKCVCLGRETNSTRLGVCPWVDFDENYTLYILKDMPSCQKINFSTFMIFTLTFLFRFMHLFC